jgi:hypothetical protein
MDFVSGGGASVGRSTPGYSLSTLRVNGVSFRVDEFGKFSRECVIVASCGCVPGIDNPKSINQDRLSLKQPKFDSTLFKAILRINLQETASVQSV